MADALSGSHDVAVGDGRRGRVDVVAIYKILLPREWASFADQGRFDGAPLDRASGFVHCSSRDQVAATAVRYFAEEPELVVVALDEARLGDVRWEPSPEGGVFPHVYGPLPAEAVRAVHHVPGAASVQLALARSDGQ